MPAKSNAILTWLSRFKREWLPNVIPDDAELRQSIQEKLVELEHLVLSNVLSSEKEIDAIWFHCFSEYPR
jgi:hypothetical protein